MSIESIFRKKSNSIDVSACGLISPDECWSVNSALINEVNKILKYQRKINDFVFVFQDHEYTLTNDSLDGSLFYKDLIHLIEQGQVNNSKFNSRIQSYFFKQW